MCLINIKTHSLSIFPRKRSRHSGSAAFHYVVTLLTWLVELSVPLSSYVDIDPPDHMDIHWYITKLGPAR